MPPLLDVDPTLAQVPLIRFEESQVAPDYVSEVDHALINILASTKTSPEMLRLANHLRDALFNINTWLLRVRQHAKQLFNMTDAELLQSSSQQILDDMEKQASYADNGQVTTSNQRQAGVEQIYSDIQHLAVFDVKPCTATSCG
jgi:hypothetical protein